MANLKELLAKVENNNISNSTTEENVELTESNSITVKAVIYIDDDGIEKEKKISFKVPAEDYDACDEDDLEDALEDYLEDIEGYAGFKSISSPDCVNEECDQSILSDELETILEMVKTNSLNNDEKEVLESSIESIFNKLLNEEWDDEVETSEEVRCSKGSKCPEEIDAGKKLYYDEDEMDSEGLCPTCHDIKVEEEINESDDDLNEAVKKRKKPNCRKGTKRVKGKCVRKSMEEIKSGLAYRKKNKKKLALAAAKWRKVNKGYISRQK